MTAEQIRNKHHVDLVDESEEGRSLDRVSRGVYGFTNSPHTESVPVYRRQVFQSFEVHKLADGAQVLLGYVTPQQAEAVNRGDHHVEMSLYPEPYGEATALVTLPLDEIVPSKKGPARIDGNPIGILLP